MLAKKLLQLVNNTYYPIFRSDLFDKLLLTHKLAQLAQY